jgi:hypothetical protein
VPNKSLNAIKKKRVGGSVKSEYLLGLVGRGKRKEKDTEG